MSNAITTSFKITCNGTTKDSLTDYEWALNNPSDCIGEPVKQTSIVTVPFGKTYDLADEMLGYPWFISRPLTLKLGYKIDLSNTNHRDYISNLRNLYEGQSVQIIFDGDYYTWIGKAFIKNATAKRGLGEFDLVVETKGYKEMTAPYGYTIVGAGTETSRTFTLDSPYPCPIKFTGTINASTTFTANGETVTLAAGTYTEEELIGLYAWNNTTLTMAGSWNLPITIDLYRRSL